MPRNNLGALNRLAFTTNILQSNGVAGGDEAAEATTTEVDTRTRLEKMYMVKPGGIKDATADADYKVSDHLPGPLVDQDREEILEAAGASLLRYWPQRRVGWRAIEVEERCREGSFAPGFWDISASYSN